MKNYYKPGCWNVICQVCGVQFKSDEIKKRWDGALVCKDDWEPRHPMDFLRATPERGTVPFSNPEPTDTFVTVNYITSTVAGTAIAGVSIAGADYPNL